MELDERDTIIRWHAATHSEYYAETIQRKAKERFADCVEVGMDRKKPEAEREAARAQAEVWAEVQSWLPNYDEAYDTMKELESEATKPEELVGVRAEDQWYEKA